MELSLPVAGALLTFVWGGSVAGAAVAVRPTDTPRSDAPESGRRARTPVECRSGAVDEGIENEPDLQAAWLA